MPITPSISATPAAITRSTIVNAICAEARSSESCSVRTSASARFLSMVSIARRTDGRSPSGAVVDRTT